MKKRKGSLLQRMMAVLLSAVLVAGTVSNAAPVTVLAQEPDGQQEGVGGNTAGTVEGGTKAEETEPETVSGNDIKADDMPETMYAAMRIGDDSPISCSLDGGTTWAGCDAIENVLFYVSGYLSCTDPIIRLNKDITVDGSGAVSLLYNNNNVLIEGQGHTITRGTNTGYLFSSNSQTGTLTFRNVTIDGGAVWDDATQVETRQNSGFSAGEDGWLIYCENADAEVILDNGAILQNNHLNNSGYNGAAVMVESGSLTMKAGAVIRNNTAIGTSGNSGGGGGAVHVNSGASFTMEGGEIYGNYASLSGGAIVNQGSFALTGGAIRDNVSGNNGGAVSAQGATVISGGEIKDNKSHAGGGIAILSGTTKISGGAVYNNIADIGGGVYNNADMSVSGTAKIYNNSQGNVYLPDSKIINIDAPLSDGAAIGVTTQTAPTDGSPVSITGTNAADYSSFFTSDNANYEIANGENNVVQLAVKTEKHEHNGVTFTPWTATDSLPTDAGNYYLTDNVTLTETWTVPNGTTTLCLNGKTISASGTDGYRVITINISPVLNLYDCRNTGNITGGKDGGVWNDGTFCMYGGKISGNATQTYNHGGGVWNNNNFYMYGGEISGNTASIGFGGGVETYGEFRMYGGKISGNTAGGSGGGVHINGSGEFIVGGGAVISGNTYNGTENNVYLKDGQWIEVDSNLLSGSANIGVTTATAPTEGNLVSVTGHNKGDCSQYFHSDNPAYEIVNANDVVQLAVKTSPDTQPPTGKIEVATGDLTSESWTGFLDKDEITFNLFFKEKKWVSIMSADEGGSGCEGTYYHVSDSALTKAQVEALEADAWTRDCTAILEPEPDRKCVVYAKITDGAGNVTYLSSDGLVFDKTAPVITGVKDGETYNTAQTVTVTDAMSGVKSVTVNGTEVTLTDNQFTLGTADGSQIIVATDQAGNTATVTVTVKTEPHTHNYGDWQHDSTQHWKVCACGDETGRGNHDFGNWITDREATAAEAGTKHRDCQTCSYTETGTVPATGTDPESGTVTPEVKPGTNAPVTNISTPTEELKDMLLTDEEKQQVQSGTDIRIVLEVQDAGNTVNDSDRAAVGQALNGSAVGQYLNIDLYKLIGEERTDIRETAKKIRIVIIVPESLKNADSGRTRTYAVLRVHDGGAERLADLDDSAETITIETDRFSIYAVVYEDEDNGGNTGSGDDDGGNNGGDNNSEDNNDGNDNSSEDNSSGGSSDGSDNSGDNNSGADNNEAKPDNTKDSEPKTGDAAPLKLYATLAMIAGFTYLLLYFTDRKRGMTEETKKELVSRLIAWAKRGGRIRTCLALAAVFVLLAYYHSIGKKTCADWNKIYGE